MTNYITELTALCATLTGSPALHFESKQMMNIKADSLTGGVCYAPAMDFGEYNKVAGGFRPKKIIVIQFLKQTPFENDLLLNMPIINDMEVLAIEFVQKMNQSTIFIHPAKYETMYHYETFDANFAGISLTFELETKQNIVACL